MSAEQILLTVLVNLEPDHCIWSMNTITCSRLLFCNSLDRKAWVFAMLFYDISCK